MPLNYLSAAASLCPCRTPHHPNSLIPSRAPLPTFSHSQFKLPFSLCYNSQKARIVFSQLIKHFLYHISHIKNLPPEKNLREPHPPYIHYKFPKQHLLLVLTTHSPPTAQRASRMHSQVPIHLHVSFLTVLLYCAVCSRGQ
jgi:hypothetical protein